MGNGHGFGLTRRVSHNRPVSFSFSLLSPLLIRVFVVQLRFSGSNVAGSEGHSSFGHSPPVCCANRRGIRLQAPGWEHRESWNLFSRPEGLAIEFKRFVTA